MWCLDEVYPVAAYDQILVSVICHPYSHPGATIHQLLVKPIFDALKLRETYAHHLARASWHGSRIIMR